MASRDLLTRTLVELADTLVNDFDIVDLLAMLTDRCVEALDVDDAGLMLAAPLGDDLRLMASSSATMRELELYELQAREGPCLDCYRSGQPVRNEDLDTTAARWPRFTPAAITAGFRSVSAVPMRLRGNVLGSLNLFRSDTGFLDDTELSAARAFADVATIAVLQHRAAVDSRRVNEQLNNALNSRVVVEQAKGMLAERAGIDVQLAFDRLRNYSRRNSLRLAAVSQDFIDGRVALAAIEDADRLR